MKTYSTSNFRIECTWHSERSGFRHRAKLYDQKTGDCLGKAIQHWQNRTWEKFEFESVMMSLLNKTDAMTDRQKRYFRKKFGIRKN
jgi:hypothetical protein